MASMQNCNGEFNEAGVRAHCTRSEIEILHRPTEMMYYMLHACTRTA